VFSLEKLKDVLVGSLGVVGYVIYSVILYVIYFLPVLILDFPLWANILIVLCIMNIPIVGGILYLAAWIWSFTIVISMPIGGFSIFYFVAFAVYFFTSLLPNIKRVIMFLFYLIKNE
jgi:hypothetical protein